ncbi:MAG: hypothetical protein IPH26_09165 [Sterolibacteriaceae bacterium]|uniref:Uncharacterized protein n=1 Tax=Candidatus Methylophosphatis roskildensis TaxID=2899263 RepID=A0A9D7DY96_9PROT|nr:hypothetical protein [Candidatus Methylophosphatis roskildensis]MBK7237493.1 hypothetical protein [Sterolibacteriaceae bacterium]
MATAQLNAIIANASARIACRYIDFVRDTAAMVIGFLQQRLATAALEPVDPARPRFGERAECTG